MDAGGSARSRSKNRAALERVKLDHGMELVRERREAVTRAGSTDDVLVLDLGLR